ncbi:hypothetical protein V1477_008957 [Vespula maculifrons]|uniref:Uncharacterized protein n=1 Tax=Vespula maculifrons TaxID=7453 RepID=A0ABD2CEI1_VESMC
MYYNIKANNIEDIKSFPVLRSHASSRFRRSRDTQESKRFKKKGKKSKWRRGRCPPRLYSTLTTLPTLATAFSRKLLVVPDCYAVYIITIKCHFVKENCK